jgi:hypothetical protein
MHDRLERVRAGFEVSAFLGGQRRGHALIVAAADW